MEYRSVNLVRNGEWFGQATRNGGGVGGGGGREQQGTEHRRTLTDSG